jgi:hypothetical protein
MKLTMSRAAEAALGSKTAPYCSATGQFTQR